MTEFANWFECGWVKSRVTQWFLAEQLEGPALTSTETGTNGRNMFTEEYQDFGLGMFIDFQVEISGGSGMYKSRA